MPSIFNNLSTFSSEHNWEGLRIQLNNQRTCTSNNHNLIGGGQFFNMVLHIFIVDLLMQHMFFCVNLISRSWRT